MKYFLTKAFFSLKFLFLILLPLAVQIETDEYCKPEDSKNMAIPFLPLQKGIFRFILSLVEATALSSNSIILIYQCSSKLEQLQETGLAGA